VWSPEGSATPQARICSNGTRRSKRVAKRASRYSPAAIHAGVALLIEPPAGRNGPRAFVNAVARLEADAELRDRWQHRFSHVLVDEFQDVDAAQLRLVRLLAAPEDNLFVVRDDDQP
jgi:hypothetical protein